MKPVLVKLKMRDFFYHLREKYGSNLFFNFINFCPDGIDVDTNDNLQVFDRQLDRIWIKNTKENELGMVLTIDDTILKFFWGLSAASDRQMYNDIDHVIESTLQINHAIFQNADHCLQSLICSGKSLMRYINEDGSLKLINFSHTENEVMCAVYFKK